MEIEAPSEVPQKGMLPAIYFFVSGKLSRAEARQTWRRRQWYDDLLSGPQTHLRMVVIADLHQPKLSKPIRKRKGRLHDFSHVIRNGEDGSTERGRAPEGRVPRDRPGREIGTFSPRLAELASQ